VLNNRRDDHFSHGGGKAPGLAARGEPRLFRAGMPSRARRIVRPTVTQKHAQKCDGMNMQIKIAPHVWVEDIILVFPRV
jgi:hypothetical protein